MTDGYQLRTISGKDFGEVASALQKSLRRGLIDDAMYWAVDLYNAGFGEYVWRRLKIITSEDVGLANAMLIVQVRALYECWKEEQKRPDGGEARLFLTQAVLAIAGSPKCRDVDNLLIYHFCRHKEMDVDVPDYAIDKHTARGKSWGRGWDHFWNVGSQLENEAPSRQSEEWRERAIKALNECKFPPDAKVWKRNRNKKNGAKNGKNGAQANGTETGSLF